LHGKSTLAAVFYSSERGVQGAKSKHFAGRGAEHGHLVMDHRQAKKNALFFSFKEMNRTRRGA
jgi:hypothetical protein